MGDFQPPITRIPPEIPSFEFIQRYNLITDDADQPFWGDNELDSTSVSDMEGVAAAGVPTAPRVPHWKYNNNNNNKKKTATRCKLSRGKRNSRFTTGPQILRKSKLEKHEDEFGSLLTQLSSFSVGPDGLRHSDQPGGVLWGRPATRERYRAAKEAREAALVAQGFSSSSDSDAIMQRPMKVRRRNPYVPSDEDLVTTSPGEVCPNCQHRPKNAIIVHGRIGHACFCYPCTMKMLRTGAECPTCGRTIRKVVKTIKAK